MKRECAIQGHVVHLYSLIISVLIPGPWNGLPLASAHATQGQCSQGHIPYLPSIIIDYSYLGTQPHM